METTIPTLELTLLLAIAFVYVSTLATALANERVKGICLALAPRLYFEYLPFLVFFEFELLASWYISRRDALYALLHSLQ